ncbi:kinase-like domain-containing protein [Lipomyces arxii]|uniref:kinase-like domain-containing protein n=1 Tax=Lipomyces arxii TaxID=56418 RepID=UPI0034CE8FCE
MEKKRSRWQDEDVDAEAKERKKQEKERKKRAKLERQQKAQQQDTAITEDTKIKSEPTGKKSSRSHLDLAEDGLLLLNAPAIKPCRSVENYERLNHIEEGSYGVVFRGRDIATGEVVALKKLKVDKNQHGFPITSLREIQTLMAIDHPNVVGLKEIVVGGSLEQIYIVMEFVEHDLKSLMDDMREPFMQSEIKTLMHQLISATAYMHKHWIIHRDLKTSNLLMNNRGMMKIADFGLARYFTDPAPPMTPLVVTLWYRAPELLLGAKQYSTEIDMWSIGCIFGELLTNKPLIEGRSEIDQISKIFTILGYPDESNWPSFRRLPNAKSINIPKIRQPKLSLRAKFPLLTTNGVDLLSQLLQMDPKKRITAAEALRHPYFKEEPFAKAPEMFPTFPSRASGEKKKRIRSPRAPIGHHGQDYSSDEDGGQKQVMLASPTDEKYGLFREQEQRGAGFQLRLG